MRSSPKETVTAAIPIHRVHPSSFWKGMILAAIVLVSSSQVSAGDKAPCLIYKNGRLSARIPKLHRTKIGENTKHVPIIAATYQTIA
ncbi:hypothetical protein ELH34_04935 [Rhizobium ruizarguesonis]|jgi:hypothetical protein|nr:hypothetical protein ELH34_04935 [Rhizobium ruizarguesonis]